MSRPWVKIDATYVEDDKVMAAGALAELVFIRSIAYCRRRFTDGYVAVHALPSLTLGVPETSETLVGALVGNRLWAVDDVKGGWRVVNYEQWQMTSEKLAAEAERKRAERQISKKRQRPDSSAGRPADVHAASDGHPLTLVADFDEPDDRFTVPPPADLRDALKAKQA